jgi:hypothetical protein
MEEISSALKEYNTENFKPDMITDKDKENFMKSVLTDKPYEEKISLFDGELRLALKTMSVEENNDVVRQISLDRDKEIAENTDAYFITISTYRLALCLTSINGEPFSSISKKDFVETDDGVSYVRARAKTIREWPTFKLSAFLAAFSGFESKVVELTNSVQSRNFWKASA